ASPARSAMCPNRPTSRRSGSCELPVDHPRVDGDPVHFPGFAAVVRKRLLEAARALGDVGDDEPDEDRAAVERLLRVELAAAVPELADRRRREQAVAGVREVETPLPRLRVVETQAESFEMAVRSVRAELHEIPAAVPDLA